MFEPKKILFPTDFSDASNHALPHALAMAQKFKAEITMVHVRTPFSDDPNTEEYQFFDENRFSNYLKEKMDTVPKSMEGVSVESVVHRDVSAPSGILNYAAGKNMDVVVMGGHGKSALGRFFLGSVTEKVVRHSTIPVLIVSPEREGYRDRPQYKRIVAAFDFSEHSRVAASQARDIALAYGADLKVLYVIEQEILPGYYEAWRQQVARERPKLVESARKSLLGILGDDGLNDVDMIVEVGDGDGRVHRDISKFVVKNEVDLIVMGTHGLSGVEHILLGSTTERVIRIAPCPVLTLHLPQK